MPRRLGLNQELLLLFFSGRLTTPASASFSGNGFFVWRGSSFGFSLKHSIGSINKAVILEVTYRIFRYNTKPKYPFKTAFDTHIIQGARRRPLPHEHLVKHVQPWNILYDNYTNSSRSFRIHLGEIRQLQQIKQSYPNESRTATRKQSNNT